MEHHPERSDGRPTDDTREVPRRERVVARSFYKELRESGYETKELLAVSTELIDLVTQELRKGR